MAEHPSLQLAVRQPRRKPVGMRYACCEIDRFLFHSIETLFCKIYAHIKNTKGKNEGGRDDVTLFTQVKYQYINKPNM